MADAPIFVTQFQTTTAEKQVTPEQIAAQKAKIQAKQKALDEENLQKALANYNMCKSLKNAHVDGQTANEVNSYGVSPSDVCQTMTDGFQGGKMYSGDVKSNAAGSRLDINY